MKSEIEKPLTGMRVLACGKGGCGRSSIVSLLTRVPGNRGDTVLALDGNASNPGRLARLLVGDTAALKGTASGSYRALKEVKNILAQLESAMGSHLATIGETP